MKQYDYEQCLKEIQIQVKRYQTFRRQQSENRSELQDIRDHMSESLLLFGPYYAEIRSNAEASEVDRKLAYEEKKSFYRNKYERKRGTADDVESDTMRDMREYYDNELAANKLYYKCRILVERADQELNSISSRLKLLTNA